MNTYRIKKSISGSILLDVPMLGELTRQRLEEISKAVARLPVFLGIRDITVNPRSRSIVIDYDPDMVDIFDYVEDMSAIVKLLVNLLDCGREDVACGQPFVC